MSPDYHARVGGPGLTAEVFPIDMDTDGDAIDAAFLAISPFGHSLWDGARFLGYFDAGEVRGRQNVATSVRPAAVPVLSC